MKDRRLLWMWLSLACRPGSVLPSTLLKFFGSPETIYEAGEEEFDAVDTNFYGHKEELCNKDLERAETILKYCKDNRIGIATPEDYFYPQRFRALPNKPMVLYYLGNFCDFDNRFTVAVVGSREPSEYGIHAAKRISYDLARAGAVIASGMASGIDSAAHRAALYNESFTVGILGCGIDRVYPKENTELYEQVIRKGLLMTEYPPGTPPVGRNFPVRNRLISAISDAVCVIEGSEQSGSLITAEDALKQEKGLYAVPGSIFAASSVGSNFLLKVGAKPCLSAYDIVEDYRRSYPELKGALPLFGKSEAKEKTPPKKKKPDLKKKLRGYLFPGSERADEEKPIPPEYEFVMVDDAIREREAREQTEKEAKESEKTKERASAALPDLAPDEWRVYSRLTFEPVLADVLLQEGEKISDLLKILTKLEIKGLVQKVAGGKYLLTDRAEA